MSFADKVKKLIDEAPVAQGLANMNYGPMVVTPLVVSWHDRQPTKTPLSEYMAEKGLDDSDDVELEKNESFQLMFDVDISALNPSLDFHYTREVQVVESSAKFKTNWTEIVRPSLEVVFGKNWYDKILPNGKKAAPILYVAVENSDSATPPSKNKETGEPKKDYGCPKFIAVYKTLDECREAREARYGKQNEGGTPVAADTDGEEDFPEDVLEQVRTLFKSTRQNKKATLKMLESQPYGEYDAQELLDAAIAE